MNEIIDRLKNLIIERAFKKTEIPTILLSSGKMSCFYFNMKKVSYYPLGQVLIGEAVFDKIMKLGLRPAAIGGETMGADPIVFSTSLTSQLKSHPIKAFSIKKEHSTESQIEGNVQKGDQVVILDDVITTGATTINAINVARNHDLIVLAAIVLVDRCEENGKQNIERTGVPTYSLFTIDDFI